MQQYQKNNKIHKDARTVLEQDIYFGKFQIGLLTEDPILKMRNVRAMIMKHY